VKPLTLQDKQDEKNRLMKAYRASKRQEWADLTAQEPRLLDFKKSLRAMRQPQQVLAMLADSWVREAPMPVRHAALRLIDKHADREARFAGRPILNDPLPPDRNVFLVAREMLAVR
jgi:hypothetical protein